MGQWVFDGFWLMESDQRDLEDNFASFGFWPRISRDLFYSYTCSVVFAEVLLVMQFEYGTSLFPAKLQDKDIFWQAPFP